MRKDEVYKELCAIVHKDLTSQGMSKGVDSKELAEAIHLDRANVSRILNELAREEKVTKLLGRPVRFLPHDSVYKEITHGVFKCNDICELDKAKDALTETIGAEGSIKKMIYQARAAILYPPFGLHTLIVGETGTGKSMFAEQMYAYAKLNNRIAPGGRFVAFNCAEYAENPQLLLSILFGYAKGSFTGADRDKPGIIEKADGGILFLDEIHRLPPEGQEKLFLVLDKGVYRRLGETETVRRCRLLIICATTEDLDTYIIKTFQRRIPVLINLPSLRERPLKERLELIEAFLKQEQQKIALPIKVSPRALKALLLYDCQGNIGQLRTDIQLLCAKALLENRYRQENYILINWALLEDEQKNHSQERAKIGEVLKLFSENQSEYILNNHWLSPEDMDNFLVN